MSATIPLTVYPNQQPPSQFTGYVNPNVIQIPYSQKDKDAAPWRFVGYPKFSEWMGSDDDFFVIRKFGALNARVILRMQDQISQLSEQLDAEDALCCQNQWHAGDRRADPSVKRQRLLDEITQLLERYNQFVLTHSQLKERPTATKRQIQNVEDWLYNNDSAVRKDEAKFIKAKGDLMTLVPKTNVPLRRFFNMFDCFRQIPCFRKDMSNGDFAPTTIHNNDERIDKVITATTITIGLGMLLAPLWWLQRVTANDSRNLDYRLGVITLFIGIFTGLLSLITVAKPFEVLGATAAYSAVLMIYLQLQWGPPH